MQGNVELGGCRAWLTLAISGSAHRLQNFRLQGAGGPLLQELAADLRGLCGGRPVPGVPTARTVIPR